MLISVVPADLQLLRSFTHSNQERAIPTQYIVYTSSIGVHMCDRKYTVCVSLSYECVGEGIQ